MHKPDLYDVSGVYDASIPPYIFSVDNGEMLPDEQLLARSMQAMYGPAQGQLNMLEVGAGTGRMTEQLAPYAGSLLCSDKYPAMLSVLQTKVPQAGTLTANTRDLAKVLTPSNQFDFVGAYWTLSYPIGELLETVEDGEIVTRPDFEAGVAEAEAMVGGLTKYLKPDGRLVAYFFDSESAEQQAVTKIWEQLAPDPGGARRFTRDLAVRALEGAAKAEGRSFDLIHYEGIAPFRSGDELKEWYKLAHCKSVDSLVGSPAYVEQTDNLIQTYSAADGSIELPVGMYELRVEG